MKVIDLLNKIANGEEVPKKIKIGCSNLTLDEDKENYSYENSDEYYGDKLIHWFNLNKEVEIIEDKKIPEKIDVEDDGNTITLYDNAEWTILNNVDVAICNKINEIIDYLEEKE